MEQNTQSNENNSQIGTNANSEQIFNEPEKKDNKKAVLLVVIVVVVVLGIVASYFLFFSDKKDDNTPVLEKEKIREIKIDKKLDSDQDGLPDYIEKVLGTDLNNSDTDGDGYSDFEEIKNGYDPLGDKKWTEEEWEAVKEEIRGESGELYDDIFEEKKIISLSQLIETCEGIKDESFKPRCIKMVCDLAKRKEEKIRKCLSDDSINKDSCLMMIMPLTVEVCDNLSNDSYKNTCYSMVIGQTKDISMCEVDSNDIPEKITCYKNLALAKDDPEICQKIDYNYFKEWCTTDSAKDFSICHSIKKGMLYWDEAKLNDQKNICLGAVTGNVNYCEKITGNKSSCYSDIAARRDDLSICDKIESDNYSKDECYMRIATKRGDSSLCNELGNKLREQCYNQISIQKADFSFCEKLLGAEQYQCYYYAMTLSLNYFDVNQDERSSLCEDIE